METQIKNHGVILGRKRSDFVAGALPYEVRNPSGDWTPYLVRAEKQWYPRFDTMACVSFSANTLCEMQIKQQTGVEVNFSDRFLAKMSGTTKQGNWLYLVGDTLRKIGGVLEEEWPVPPGDFGWDDYYTPIPQFVIDRAQKQFRDLYDIGTEWITRSAEEIAKHLKHAPLQVVIPGHAVAGYIISAQGDEVTYFDTYDPFIKKARLSDIQDVYKILLTVKKMIEFVHIAGTEEYGFLESTPFTRILHRSVDPEHAAFQAKLFKLAVLTPEGKVDFTKARDITL